MNQDLIFSNALALTVMQSKVIIEKSRVKVSLMEQEKIENVSCPIKKLLKNKYFFNFLKGYIIFLLKEKKNISFLTSFYATF